jgi:hypothetical protein
MEEYQNRINKSRQETHDLNAVHTKIRKAIIEKVVGIMEKITCVVARGDLSPVEMLDQIEDGVDRVMGTSREYSLAGWPIIKNRDEKE